MAAFAALRSLEDTIKGLPRNSSAKTLRSAALHHACSLLRTLEMCNEGVGDMDEQIIMEAARKLEDAIEFSLLSQPPTFSFNLDDDDVDCFVKTAKERKQIIEGLWEQKKAAKMIEENIEPDQEEEDVEMVGLCDQFLQIRDKVVTAADQLVNRMIWISSMAGIGKTALAKKVFDDPLVKTIFQCRALIRVGRSTKS